jgi:hypothetical protein
VTLTFSRRLAVVAGVILPIGETARRWHQLGDPRMWPAWFDDIIIAGFLLYGSWRATQDAERGRPVLAAAWGFALGIGYASFVFSLMNPHAIDASGVDMRAVALVKGGMVMIAIAGLVGAARWKSA